MNPKVKTLLILLASILVSCCGKSPTLDPAPCLTNVRVTLLFDDMDARQAHIDSARDITSASEGMLNVTISDGGTITSRIDGDALGEAGDVAGARGDISHGELIFRSAYWAGRRPVVTHEMLHLLGFQHTSVMGDIMCYCTTDPNRVMSSDEVRRVREFAKAQCGG